MTQRHIPEVDGLRAAAVGAVIASHFLGPYVPNGGVGVDLFFVISGVVITRSLLLDRERQGGISLGHFYLKRVNRIMPALWLLIAVTLLIGAITGRSQLWYAAATFASVMNWARAFGWFENGGSLAHAWSLSIEEQFYLIWPLALMLLLKARGGTRLAVVAGAAIAIAAWRSALTLSDVGIVRIYNGLDTHSDGLMLGCLLTLWGRPPPRWLSAGWWIPVAGLSFLVLSSGMSAGPGLALRWILIPVLSAWIVYVALGPRTLLHPLLRLGVVQWGGTRSYSLYLWHFPILYYLEPWTIWLPVKALAMLILTAAAAEASYRFVEQPFQRRGRARAEQRLSRGSRPESLGLAAPPPSSRSA
ncbi:MAG TPA: acyltransferase [Allosphingosinicella sp.]|jgi:peptidoglycan/LPS O-acetylase OafA/YrhL